MRRSFLPFLASLAFSAPAAFAFPWGPVDLGRPGALDAIRDEDPARFERLAKILRAAEQMPCTEREFERAMRVHDARAARCSLMLKTSYPAKRTLHFTLDSTRYVATITMDIPGFALQRVEK